MVSVVTFGEGGSRKVCCCSNTGKGLAKLVSAGEKISRYEEEHHGGGKSYLLD